jgi:ribonuclease HI
VYCDGAWATSRAGAAAILIPPSSIKLRYTTHLEFTKETDKCSNNIARYEAVLLELHVLQAMGVQNYILKRVSKVIAGQIEKECKARDATLEKYLAIVRGMENYLRVFTVEYIERTKNTKVDKLATAVAKKQHYP